MNDEQATMGIVSEPETVTLRRMGVQVRAGVGALQRPRRSPGLHIPRGDKSLSPSLWWVRRPPSFIAGLASTIEISGRRVLFNTRRFEPRTDATSLAGDFRMIASDFARAEADVLAKAGQQQLFDPDAPA